MQLSVILVSFNVRYFLEQCLYSVRQAMEGVDGEVIVIDNHSSDGTAGYLRSFFPEVKIVENPANIGFAAANNQALALARGKYVLFLNPDTLVPEGCFLQCISRFEMDQNTGALGVRMVDGSGKFLPESKRAFPAPQAAFFKLSGLAALFPQSAIFNRYGLGMLSEEGDHEVEVLAGAFLFMKKSTIDLLGGFDEAFFLYGEDVDLSYRIRQAGFKNIYLGTITVIHFKGESTRAYDSHRTRHFYESMLIFVRKHYRGTAAGKLWLIKLGIALRGLAGFVAGTFRKILLPLIDLMLLLLCFNTVRMVWIMRMRAGIDFHVPFISFALPLFSLVFIAVAAVAGLYDKRYKTSGSILAIITGAVALLALYSVLPESLRFSRGVVIIGALLGGALILWFRQSLFRQMHRWLGYKLDASAPVYILASAGEHEEMRRLIAGYSASNKAALINLDENEQNEVLPHRIYKVSKPGRLPELVFCIGGFSLTAAITVLSTLRHPRPRMLFHYTGSRSLVGSDYAAQQGRSFGEMGGYGLADPQARRMKRLADLLLAILLLVAAPFHIFLHPRPLLLFRRSMQVLVAQRTWIGYEHGHEGLPPLRKRVISARAASAQTDQQYARLFNWWRDMITVLKNYRKLS